MYLIRKFSILSIAIAFGISLVSFFTPNARANVYATNIKLNGALSNVTNAIGGSVSISFILNEPATSGTKVQILSGTNILRTISIASGNSGTLKGTNTVVWNGLTDGGINPPSGILAVSIIPSATGFANWTITSSGTNAGYHVFMPRGIAVNNNSNSLYYGRVFVGNAANNGSGPGDADGILKANADGSLADEGQSSGGYTWDDQGFDLNPHFLRYGQDDRIYALNWDNLGEVVAFDMVMSTNQMVLTADNYSSNPYSLSEGWGMFDITDAGTTNARIFLGDYDEPDGAGLWAWRMTNGMADPNDHTGTQVIAVGGDLSLAANGGSMMDSHSNIFIGQNVLSVGDPTSRVMEFTNWDGSTILTNGTAWQAGANDNTFLGNFDLALDSRVNPKYVAVCLARSGGLRVLDATTGLVISSGTNTLSNLDSQNAYFGVAWDGVGNLYGAVGNTTGSNMWRVFSPPGTNQATTVAVEKILQMGNAAAPVITGISVNGTTVAIDFTGSISDTTASFSLVSSDTLSGAFANASGVTISQVNAGVFRATITSAKSAQFYRIKRGS